MTCSCCSACPPASRREPDGTVELPFDPRTGVLRPEVWQRWLDWDPVRMVPRYASELRSLRAIWIDGGTRDEWFLDVGAQAFRAALREAGVPDEVIHFELFEATPHGRSTTATRSRSPGSASASRPERRPLTPAPAAAAPVQLASSNRWLLTRARCVRIASTARSASLARRAATSSRWSAW